MAHGGANRRALGDPSGLPLGPRLPGNLAFTGKKSKPPILDGRPSTSITSLTSRREMSSVQPTTVSHWSDKGLESPGLLEKPGGDYFVQ